MVHAVTPILGFRDNLTDASGYWDAGHTTPAGAQNYSPALGTVVTGSDGHDYILAKASGAVAAAAAVILTEPGMTFAAGAGAWTTTVANQAIGDITWLQKIAA